MSLQLWNDFLHTSENKVRCWNVTKTTSKSVKGYSILHHQQKWNYWSFVSLSTMLLQSM